MSASLTISVIIPSLNSPQIDQVITALHAQTVAPQEILVVGLDHLALVTEDSRVRMIDTKRPICAAAARNLGARLATGDVLCYIDADCIARPNWLADLLAHHHAGATVVGGGVAIETDDYWRLCDNLVAFTLFLETSTSGERPYLPSLNFSIRRHLFLDMGGFDESFPGAAGEDTDFSFRLRRAGHTLAFAPQAAVIHRHLRASPHALWRHIYAFGKTYMAIYPCYPDLLGNWRRINLSFGRSQILRALGPGLALCDLIERMVRYPQLRPYAFYAPGLLLGMLAWYDGAATGLAHRPIDAHHSG